MVNMHREYHFKQREKASEFIKRWQSGDMHEIVNTVGKFKTSMFWNKHPTQFDRDLFDVCHSVVAELKRNADGIETLQSVQSEILKSLYEKTNNPNETNTRRQNKDAVDSLLDFFEHMGQDVKNHVADSDYLKDFFYSDVIDNYELFRKYLEYDQISKSKRSSYCNFVYLAQAWEKQGGLPVLPRICIRPPVITAEDLNRVYQLRNMRN